MPKLLAIELSSNTATCVSATVEKSGPIQIHDIFTTERKVIEESTEEENEDTDFQKIIDFKTPETFEPLEFQSVSAILNQSKVIYTNSKLPFSDPRTVSYTHLTLPTTPYV